MFMDIAELPKEFKGWKFAVMVFNKDTRTFLRGYNAGFKSFDFTVEYLIDFTLPFRPNIAKIAEDTWPKDKIITDPFDFQIMAEEGAFDALLVFEEGYENTFHDHLGPTDYVEINSFSDVVKKCRDDYDNYLKMSSKAEFNFRWSKYCLEYLADYMEQQQVVTLSAYNNPLVANIGDCNSLILFNLDYHTIPVITDDFHKVPVRFVLGEDWGVGKTSYLMEQMEKGASGMACDFWFLFLSPYAIPSFGPADLPLLRGVAANMIFKASNANPGKPVYIKFDGRLEEFIYGFPKDRTLMIQDWWKFFDDFQVVFVFKPERHERMDQLIEAFKTKYGMSDKNIKKVMMPYCGKSIALEG